ncbi:MAG: outer membrane beta-barrel protein [Tannerellaceae bacterium]|jgi:hypothetical protein|nr:outer membrane beta-barrel protein [Tannerellaceae bacterium]
MKIKILLLFIFCFFIKNSESQVLKLNAGISYSSFSHENIDILDLKIMSPSFSLSYEYFKKKYFELSSEMAYIQKGGKENDFIINDNNNMISYTEIKEKFDYLNLNSTFRFKYPFFNNYVYIGFGPKIDILLSDNKLNHYKYTLNRILFGFKPEIGFSQNLNKKINVGLNFSYLWNIGKVGKSEYSDLHNTYYSINFSIGYIL